MFQSNSTIIFFVWTLCPTKAKNGQTNTNFGRKMSDVRPLFQALQHYGMVAQE